MSLFNTFSLKEGISEPILSQDQVTDSELSSHDADTHSDDGELMQTDDSDNGLDSDEENPKSNSGWADAMAKILKTNKPKGKKSVVLAKAKKLSTVLKREKVFDPGFEIEGEEKEEKPSLKNIDKLRLEKKPNLHRIKKLEWYSKGRQKPNILEKDREKTLSKIGTKGVVQLFNAVRQQQKMIEARLEEIGSGPAKREKVLKTINKKTFLDVVMGSVKSQPVDSPVKEEEVKELKAENKTSTPSWQVLHEDFMMGGRYKDWDRSEAVNEPDNQLLEVESESD